MTENAEPQNVGHDESAAKSGNILSAFLVYADRRIAVMLGLGFAAGLPNLLIFDTLSAWLRASGLSLEVISFFSLATLSYSFKFLWAPVVDRTHIPVLTKMFGHRRSWMLIAQALIFVGLLCISAGDPKVNLGFVALFAVFTGFSSATQDIVIDAWRIEAAEVSRQGAMAAAYQWGYRIAIVVAGAVPLVLADSYGWNFSYGLMAFLMLLGATAVLLAPREQEHKIREIPTTGMKSAPLMETLEWLARLLLIVIGALFLGSGLSAKVEILTSILKALDLGDLAQNLAAIWATKETGIFLQLVSVLLGFAFVILAAWPIPRVQTRPGVYLFHALGDPLADLLKRFGSATGLILALICLYRLSDFVLNIMTPFYQDLGFTLTQIAEARKVFGVVMSMVGVFGGGFSIARFGLMRSLVVGAFALPVTNTIFAWLATQGPDMRSLFFAIGVDNFVSGYAGTCLIAYMSSLTGVGFTATQYALFSSLYSLPGKLVASQSGRIVESAARASEHGGPLAFLQRFFVHAPPEAFAGAMAKSHVAPAALGAGYIVFFIYSGLVGIASMILAVLVARRHREQSADKAA
ncbi:MAG: MFS transporter [Proteobacteria bacterium]|nr:MFS transporter [Pseudomonadota bacterium]